MYTCHFSKYLYSSTKYFLLMDYSEKLCIILIVCHRLSFFLIKKDLFWKFPVAYIAIRASVIKIDVVQHLLCTHVKNSASQI